MGEELLLVGARGAGGGGVGDDGLGAAAVEEVDGRGLALTVGAGESSGEVRRQVDGLSFDHTWSEDARNWTRR